MARILIIDDDPDIIDSLTMILEGNGYEAESKTDTNNLVESIIESNPDLVILDVIFPEDPQAGFLAARQIAKEERLKGIPILMLSAVNQQSNLSFGFSSMDIGSDFMPVHGFIEKPVEPGVLLSKIEELLNMPSDR